MTTTDITAEYRQVAVAEKAYDTWNSDDFAKAVSSAFGPTARFSMKQALRQSAVMLCGDVISQDISKATLQMRERLANGTSRVVLAQEHPVASFLTDMPNSRHTWMELTQMSVFHGVMHSNSHEMIVRDGKNDILSIAPIPHGQAQDMINPETGEVFYQVTAASLQDMSLYGFSTARIPERDMFHYRSRMLDGMNGYSTLGTGGDTLATAKAISDYRNNLFAEGGEVRGVFQRDAEGALDDQAFNRLKRQLTQMMRRRDPIILEDKLKFQQIAVKPADAELTDQLGAQIEAVAQLFRVPLHKLFHMAAVKYENLESMDKQYSGDTLIPICTLREQRYARHLLSKPDRARFFFEYDRDALTVIDPKAEVERVTRLYERGVIMRGEARSRMKLAPGPDDSVFCMPANTILIDPSNKIIIGAQDPAGQNTEDNADKPEKPEKALRLAIAN